ncbi:hypothetical protein E4U53_003036 [Claviceps sorghi]|nr:hypothetical protein E4U53_003036 [Claviceps sorghi]
MGDLEYHGRPHRVTVSREGRERDAQEVTIAFMRMESRWTETRVSPHLVLQYHVERELRPGVRKCHVLLGHAVGYALRVATSPTTVMASKITRDVIIITNYVENCDCACEYDGSNELNS